MGSQTEYESSISLQTDLFANFFNKPEVIIIIVTIFLLILIKLYLGNNENKTFTMIFIEVLLYLIIGFILFANLIYLLFGIQITTTIYNILSNNPILEFDINTPSSSNSSNSYSIKDKDDSNTIIKEKEVFHVSGNKYRYQDAEPICKAYGARLANYDEIERAYENGAEWCGYGWSEGQMAFFPTQKKTWRQMQDSEKHKNNCGRPGINGGYFENPDIKFGVNCYGIKPDITDNEKCLMENTSYYDIPDDPIEKVRENYWKQQLDKLLLNPFNQNKWSRY